MGEGDPSRCSRSRKSESAADAAGQGVRVFRMYKRVTKARTMCESLVSEGRYAVSDIVVMS